MKPPDTSLVLLAEKENFGGVNLLPDISDGLNYVSELMNKFSAATKEANPAFIGIFKRGINCYLRGRGYVCHGKNGV